MSAASQRLFEQSFSPVRVVLNERVVWFRLAHQQLAECCEPVLVTVAAPVRLSVADVAAVLFCWDTATYTDLAEDDYVRRVVGEAVLNAGCSWLEHARCEAAAVVSGTPAADFLSYCRQRAVTVFATAPAAKCATAGQEATAC